MNRRQFLGSAAVSAAAFSIVPRHVLGGPGQVAPSQKVTLALIGCGTEGLREMLPVLGQSEVQMVAVCDPNRDSTDYVDWSKNGLRNDIRKALEQPTWRAGAEGIPGGREVAKEVVEAAYSRRQAGSPFKGCAAYADFRDLLAREQDLDAVWIMTPDHLHATIAIAAMKRGKHVLMHKPLANRVREARLVVETTRQTRVATHFLPAGAGDAVTVCADWIRQGAIGTLREVHNWSNRPVWPQYPTLPKDTPPVPKDFDWDLWLGPSQPRPYHPHYTHAVFRGWYEFGGGPVADMGHYSLWKVFTEFDLDAPILVESTPSHVCTVLDQVSTKIHNDYSFPAACTIRFRFAAKGARPALDLFWYDGGIRPPTPEELLSEGKELAPEGMLFVGDSGKILGGFRGEDPVLLSSRKGRVDQPAQATGRNPAWGNTSWVKTFRGGEPTAGSFLLAGPISEAFNLAAISLRLGGKRLVWNSSELRVTNLPDANALLTREYRKGWELAG